MSKMKFNHMKLASDYHKKVRELSEKEKRFIAQVEIARNMKVNRVTLHRVMKKELVPELETIVRICRWIGKPIDDYVL